MQMNLPHKMILLRRKKKLKKRGKKFQILHLWRKNLTVKLIWTIINWTKHYVNDSIN